MPSSGPVVASADMSAVQGIVSATIQPIHAKDLMLGSTQQFTDAEDDAREAFAESVVNGGPITLHAPQFEQAPVDGDLSTIRCNGATLERAAVVAATIIGMQEQMPVNPLSADLLTLAYAYLSRHHNS